VTNSGKGTATGLTVTGGLGAKTCGRTTLPAMSAANCLLTHVITQADMDRGSITDRAIAKAVGEDKKKVSASSGTVSVALKGSARLTAVQMVTQVTDLNRDGHAGEGDKMRYSLRITNTGTLTVRRINVVDGKLNQHGLNLTCPTTTLAPGASVTCTAPLYTVSRWEAKHSPLANRAFARGTTATGVTVASNGTVTYRLTVPPVKRVVKHRSNTPAKTHTWVKKTHQSLNKRHHVKQHKVRLVAKIRAAQWLSTVTDKNKNGRFDAGDSAVYSFKVVNAGNVTVSDLAIVDRKLARKNLKITCDQTTLVPGATAVCHAEPLVFTKWQAKHNKTLGKNWAYATAVASTGKAIRSNSTVTDHGIKAKADPEPSLLAYTGVEAGSVLLSGVFLMGLGAFLKVGSRRRRTRRA
jgi:hypothetical protein